MRMQRRWREKFKPSGCCKLLKNVPWVVMRDFTTLVCQGCEGELKLPDVFTVEGFHFIVRGFQECHLRCGKGLPS